MTLHAKMAISDSHGTLAWDNQYELDKHAFNLKTDYFLLWFLCKNDLRIYIWELLKINILKPRKITKFFLLFIKRWFQCFKVNLALPSFHGRSLEITLGVHSVNVLHNANINI